MTATDTDPPPYQATDAAAEEPGVNDTDFPSFSYGSEIPRSFLDAQFKLTHGVTRKDPMTL